MERLTESQFELIEGRMEWSPSDMAFFLASKLSEDALMCITMLSPEERGDYVKLVAALSHRFGADMGPWTVQAELSGRHRRTVRTDHAAIQWLMSFREPEGQIDRWLEELQAYDFEIEHRPGTRHTNAGASSRRPCTERDVADFCRRCDECTHSQAPLQQLCAGAALEKVAVDIVGPLPITDRGNRYILTAMDYFSKWPEAYPIADMEAETRTHWLRACSVV
ncbi:Retrovirus-related Pol poly from transposon [Solea senegalensis]|uniref:Retrovirus-related Pol poly from transposon n=1 Tax=Solea senegalensis TaxID=28829 RepID=A0AAV6SW92_SOLSE|nr:Retrovirus-related Pol poly from transposon [Solea senegalensis]